MTSILHRLLGLASISAALAALVACTGSIATDQPPTEVAPTGVPARPASPTEGWVAAGPIEVRIKMTEFAIESSLTTFRTGVPYRLVLDSAGALAHDFRITPRGEAQSMVGMQSDGHAHEHGNELLIVPEPDLPPGATVTKDITFNQPGDFEFACHVAGHLEAGMVLPIAVAGETVVMPTPIDPASIRFDAGAMADMPCHAMGLTIMGDCRPEDVERLKAEILAKDAAMRDRLGGGGTAGELDREAEATPPAGTVPN